MRKWGIRNRLIVSYILLIMISLLLLGSYILWFFYRHNLENLTSNLVDQALIAEKLVEDYHSNETMQNINQRIQLLGESINFRVTVIRSDGVVLADSQYETEKLENHRSRPEIAAALSGTNGSDIHYNIRAKENWLYAAVPLYQNNTIIGVVRMSTSLNQVEAGYRKLASALLTALILTSILGILLSIKLAKKYTAPLEAITKGAQLYSEGQLDTRVYVRTGDELELLAQTFNTLARNLNEKIDETIAEKQKLEIILEHMDNAVMLLDRYGKVVTANKTAVDMFGITEDMIGQHNIQVIGNSILDRAITQIAVEKKSKLIDLKTNISNKKRILQVFIAPIIDSGNVLTGILTVFHDITALHEMQERQTDFVANASHELATPLTAIKGFTETLLDGALEDPQLSRKFTEIIHTEANRMHNLIQDLLRLAKISSQDYAQQLHVIPTAPDSIIKAAVDELMPSAKRKNLCIVSKTAGNEAVLADPDWLKQVLVNLIENSIKYTPEKGKIILEYWTDDKKGYFMVKDTGIGIPAKDLPLIFDRFYRVDRARSRSAGGSGLGLSIVKFIVELLGGAITVKSEVGLGTTFIFHLPLAK